MYIYTRRSASHDFSSRIPLSRNVSLRCIIIITTIIVSIIIILSANQRNKKKNK